MRKFIVIMFACVCMCACKTTRPTYIGHTDTLYVNKEYHDTLYRVQLQFDSIWQHDSIWCYKEGEVQVKEVYRDKVRYKVHHDTIWRSIAVADTTYKVHNDSIVIRQELTKLQKLKLECFSFLVFLLLVMFIAIVFFLHKNEKL